MVGAATPISPFATIRADTLYGVAQFRYATGVRPYGFHEFPATVRHENDSLPRHRAFQRPPREHLDELAPIVFRRVGVTVDFKAIGGD